MLRNMHMGHLNLESLCILSNISASYETCNRAVPGAGAPCEAKPEASKPLTLDT